MPSRKQRSTSGVRYVPPAPLPKIKEEFDPYAVSNSPREMGMVEKDITARYYIEKHKEKPLSKSDQKIVYDFLIERSYHRKLQVKEQAFITQYQQNFKPKAASDPNRKLKKVKNAKVVPI
jgi:hypothetical protein